MKFIVPNYSCLQNPWKQGANPRSPFSLSSTEFVEPPPPNKIPVYATEFWIALLYMLPVKSYESKKYKLCSILQSY